MMAVNDLLGVIHTTVANFDGIPVEDFSFIENIKKDICRIFNSNGLRITIEANKKIIDFLDITFNLNQCSYRPYTKPNTTLKYVRYRMYFTQNPTLFWGRRGPNVPSRFKICKVSQDFWRVL